LGSSDLRVIRENLMRSAKLFQKPILSHNGFITSAQPNGPALSCGVDKFRDATNETSSC
jgi:hypothetical protein